MITESYRRGGAFSYNLERSVKDHCSTCEVKAVVQQGRLHTPHLRGALLQNGRHLGIFQERNGLGILIDTTNLVVGRHAMLLARRDAPQSTRQHAADGALAAAHYAHQVYAGPAQTHKSLLRCSLQERCDQ